MPQGVAGWSGGNGVVPAFDPSRVTVAGGAAGLAPTSVMPVSHQDDSQASLTQGNHWVSSVLGR